MNGIHYMLIYNTTYSKLQNNTNLPDSKMNKTKQT